MSNGRQADAAALCFTTRLRRRSHRFPRKSSAFQVLSCLVLERVRTVQYSTVQDLTFALASTKVLLVACESTARCTALQGPCHPVLSMTGRNGLRPIYSCRKKKYEYTVQYFDIMLSARGCTSYSQSRVRET